jgi:hypothetical protein
VELFEMLEFSKFIELKPKYENEYNSIYDIKVKFSEFQQISIKESFKAYDSLRLFIKLSGYDEDSMKEETDISDEPQYF